MLMHSGFSLCLGCTCLRTAAVCIRVSAVHALKRTPSTMPLTDVTKRQCWPNEEYSIVADAMQSPRSQEADQSALLHIIFCSCNVNSKLWAYAYVAEQFSSPTLVSVSSMVL